MNNNSINSGTVTGSNRPRRPRITKYVNIKDMPVIKVIPVELRIKKLYKELEMDSNQILTHKLKLCKN
jgi:hypothetical protein